MSGLIALGARSASELFFGANSLVSTRSEFDLIAIYFLLFAENKEKIKIGPEFDK